MQEIPINWELIFWAFGIFGAIISALLAWIGVMMKDEKKRMAESYETHEKRLKKHDKIFIKHDKKFAKQHSEIKSLIMTLKPNG